jgi:hypothetical protein
MSAGWHLPARWHERFAAISRPPNFLTIIAPRVWHRSCGSSMAGVIAANAIAANRKSRKETVMPDTKTKDAVDKARAATQELHRAISDAAAKRGGAIKADLEAVPQKSRAVIESIKSSAAAQNEVAKKRLAEAITYLEATGKHAADGAKSSGKEFQTAVRQTIADARAAAQKVSEAVAAKRTVAATQGATR